MPGQGYSAYSGLGGQAYLDDGQIVGSEVIDGTVGYPGMIPPGGIVVDQFESRPGEYETLPRGSSNRSN